MMDTLHIIAQNINSVNPAVRRIVLERHVGRLRRLLRRIQAAGATAVDIAIDFPGMDRLDAYRWVLDQMRNTTPALRPVIDWPDPAAWHALLPHAGAGAIVNSLHAYPLHADALRVLAAHRPGVIVLCATETTTRLTPAERLDLAYAAYRALRSCGIPDSAIYFDALLFPYRYARVGTSPEDTLETVRRLRRHFPGCHILIALENLTFRMPSKIAYQSAFLAMAIAAGVDTVMMDPLRRPVRAVARAAWTLTRVSSEQPAHVTGNGNTCSSNT